jgi:hypothetical protein
VITRGSGANQRGCPGTVAWSPLGPGLSREPTGGVGSRGRMPWGRAGAVDQRNLEDSEGQHETTSVEVSGCFAAVHPGLELNTLIGMGILWHIPFIIARITVRRIATILSPLIRCGHFTEVIRGRCQRLEGARGSMRTQEV